MQARRILSEVIDTVLTELNLSRPEKLVIESPNDPKHGDLATNAALLLAKQAHKSPRDLAENIVKRIVEICPQIEKAETAGPGFCNFYFKPAFWQKTINTIEECGAKYGKSTFGAGRKVLVEYVSANPTGPLHVGHGRGAAAGDSLARILRAAGYEVSTEYYLNDAGRQMRTLGLSIWLRVKELNGQSIDFPDDCYKGDYIKDIAKNIMSNNHDIIKMEEVQAREFCQLFGMNQILQGIKEDLAAFRCEHQIFFSEKSLVDSGAVDRSFHYLKDNGISFEKDGALWFGTKNYGDDQDRVLRKSDGSLTYFASDIAYHYDKFQRGFNWLIDVWGADHHGYIPRMKAAITAMGESTENFSVLLIQLVNLLRDGKTVSMSTRAGEFETLYDVIKEVGVDAARFMFLSRSCDSPLDFDLNLAKSRTLDNPVYYVQYAHARVCALLRRAETLGLILPEYTDNNILELLNTPEDLSMLKYAADFENLILSAAKNLSPHLISTYLLHLAGLLHSYYGKYTIISQTDENLSKARLSLLRAIKQVLYNGLFLLGVSAPESM